jgi:hypothetical protein
MTAGPDLAAGERAQDRPPAGQPVGTVVGALRNQGRSGHITTTHRPGCAFARTPPGNAALWPRPERDLMTGPGRAGQQAQPALRHAVPRRIWTPMRPDLLPAQGEPEPASQAATMTPGRALIALLAELAACGLPVAGMTITRLQGTLTLPGGPVVRYCCGWLVWPAGRPGHRGRPLRTLHSAHDPAGAARGLAQHATLVTATRANT